MTKASRVVRGFTLVEVLVCLGLLAVLVYPIYSMVETTIKAHDDSIRQLNLRSDLTRAEAQIKRLTQGHSTFQIDANNRGLHWADGTSLNWKEAQLFYKDRPLVDNVDSFALFKRNGAIFVTLRLREPKTKRLEQIQFQLGEANHA